VGTTKQNIPYVPPGYYDKSISKNLFQRFWHGRRFSEVSEMVEITKGDILDVGSCDGKFSNVVSIATKCRSLVGVDAVQDCVDYANNKYKNTNKTFIYANAQKLPFSDNSFDAVFLLEVLEHVENPVKTMNEIRRVLKSNHNLYIMVPLETLLFKGIWSIWTLFKGKVWKDAHIQHFKYNSIREFLLNNNFNITKEKTFILNMLYLAKCK